MSENKLIDAAIRGNLEELKKLIDAGADVNAKDEEGWTARMYADFFGNKDCYDLLKKAGAKELL